MATDDDHRATYDTLIKDLHTALSRIREASASSEGGGVTVVVGPDGTVMSVEFNSDWRREVQVDELTELILHTVGEAHATQLGQWIEGPGAAQLTEPPVPTENRFALPPPMGGQDVRSLVDAIAPVGWTEGVMDDLVARMRDIVTRSHEAASSDGRVIASVDGHGQLVGLKIDRDWAANARDAALGYAVTTAIRSAIDSARERTLS